MKNESKEVLTVRQAAEVLNCHYNSVYKYVRKGLLKAEKVKRGLGSKYEIKLSDLELFKQENNL